MKILLVSSVSIVGGGEHNLRLLAQQLSAEHSVTLLVSRTICHFYSLPGVKVIPHDFPRRTWLKGFYTQVPDDHLSKLAEEADVVHFYCVNSLPLFRGVDRRKTVWTCHGSWEVTSKMKAKKILLQVGKVLFVSKSVQHKLLSKFGRNGEVAYIGSELKDSKPGETFQNVHPFNLFCLGRFQWIKGQDLLIDAVSKVRNKKRFNVHFFGRPGSSFREKLFYGYCILKAKALQTVTRGSSYHFHGYQAEPFTKINKQNSLVVVPSRYESFSMVTVESLANGLPAIVPKNSGATEIVNCDTLGRSFQPRNVKSLGRAILDYDDLMLLSKDNLRKRAAEFHVSEQAKRLLDIYQSQIEAN
jgi:glycosyltransferase involved in cell wall biosynthesis